MILYRAYKLLHGHDLFCVSSWIINAFTISIYLFTFITVILVYCIERQTQRTTWINGVQIMNVFFLYFFIVSPFSVI
jgi:hypothetical protein